jgi:hypothetical protein
MILMHFTHKVPVSFEAFFDIYNRDTKKCFLKVCECFLGQTSNPDYTGFILRFVK